MLELEVVEQGAVSDELAGGVVDRETAKSGRRKRHSRDDVHMLVFLSRSVALSTCLVHAAAIDDLLLLLFLLLPPPSPSLSSWGGNIVVVVLAFDLLALSSVGEDGDEGSLGCIAL